MAIIISKMSSSLINLLGTLSQTPIPPPVVISGSSGGGGGTASVLPAYLFETVDETETDTGDSANGEPSQNSVGATDSFANYVHNTQVPSLALVKNGTDTVTSSIGTCKAGVYGQFKPFIVGGHGGLPPPNYNLMTMQRALLLGTQNGSTMLYPTQRPDKMQKASFLPLSPLKTFPNTAVDTAPTNDFYNINYQAGGLGSNLLSTTLYNSSNGYNNTPTADQNFGSVMCTTTDGLYTLVATTAGNGTVVVYSGSPPAATSTLYFNTGLQSFDSSTITSLDCYGYEGRLPVGIFTDTYIIAVGISNTVSNGTVALYGATTQSGKLVTTTAPLYITPGNGTPGYGQSVSLSRFALVVGAPTENWVCTYSLAYLTNQGGTITDSNSNSNNGTIIQAPDSSTNFGRLVRVNATGTAVHVVSDSGLYLYYGSYDNGWTLVQGYNNTYYGLIATTTNSNPVVVSGITSISADASGTIIAATTVNNGVGTVTVYSSQQATSDYFGGSDNYVPLAILTNWSTGVGATLSVTGNRLVVVDANTLYVYAINYSYRGTGTFLPGNSHDVPVVLPTSTLITTHSLSGVNYGTVSTPNYTVGMDWYGKTIYVGIPQATQNSTENVGEVVVYTVDTSTNYTYRPLRTSPPVLSIKGGFWYPPGSQSQIIV